MKGTLVNCGTILIGSVLGIALGQYVPERFRTIMTQALGLATILIGVRMAVAGSEVLLTVGCLLCGGVLGEWINVEKWIEKGAERLKKNFASDSTTFVHGFVTTSILYLTGPMTIVGSIQDGISGDTSTLFLKAILDGIASIAFASIYGIGVAFSALSVLIVQGAITISASYLIFLKDPAVLHPVISTGGIMIVGIGLNLMNVTRIRVGNFLPALLLVLAWVSFAR
ncbi:MAG: DUF554 domain-containing protein [Syntrophales bacterium]|jgi:uncharacterized membrane protein YqgA involved in biofilm formation|nr:DUF554 domain-containing protein [Syntrophales bacterium]